MQNKAITFLVFSLLLGSVSLSAMDKKEHTSSTPNITSIKVGTTLIHRVQKGTSNGNDCYFIWQNKEGHLEVSCNDQKKLTTTSIKVGKTWFYRVNSGLFVWKNNQGDLKVYYVSPLGNLRHSSVLFNQEIDELKKRFPTKNKLSKSENSE